MVSIEGFVIEDESCGLSVDARSLSILAHGFEGDVRVHSGSAAATHTWTTNPATGAPWTVAEVNALEAGFRKYETNALVDSETRVTQLYVTVTSTRDSYTYDSGPTGINTLTSITGASAATFAYTFNGDLWMKNVSGVTWTYTYNEMGLLKEVKEGSTVKATYAYDGLGRRVKTVEDGATTYFVYGLGIDPIWEKTGTTETRHFYANGMRIARQVVGGSTYYYHTDALGSTWRITDATKATVFSTSYEPFGRSWGTTGSLFGTERYRFLGERNDTVTGQTYLRARQYDPEIGRFISADPVLGALAMPQTLNRYAYVVNNPLKYTDPTGEFIPLLILAGLLIGAAIGGASYGYHVATTGAEWNWGDFGVSVGIGALGGAVAGATFGLGAAAMGVTSMAGLSGLGYGAMFLLGGVAGFAAYHAEVGATWLATGRNTWSLEGAVGSFVLGGLFAMGGKALGSLVRGYVLRSWIRAFNRAYAETEALLGPRPAGAGAGPWGEKLHQIFQSSISKNPLLRLLGVRSPVRVNGPGADSTWAVGRIAFKVTPSRQVGAHLSRSTFQPYIDEAWLIIFMNYA
jgi:RHS repeat-associated protein